MSTLCATACTVHKCSISVLVWGFANHTVHSLAHTASKLFPVHLTAISLVPNSSPIPHIQEPHTYRSQVPTKMTLEPSSISVLQDMSMGLEECQRFFGLRLRKLVLTFSYHPRIIINPFFAGWSRNFKRASCSARSYSFNFNTHHPVQIDEHSAVISELDVSTLPMIV